jgi:hypothetical protein
MVFCPYVHGSTERSVVRSTATRRAWLLTGVCVAAIGAGLAVEAAAAQFVPFSHDTRNILEGHWQSCRERDGSTPSASTITSSTACRSSKCTWARGGSSRSSKACRTRTAITTRREPPETLQRAARSEPRQAALGNPVAEPRVHGDDVRRIADRLRELVHPPRAAGKNFPLI